MQKTGELNTVWGGHAEPISYNPYSPNGGETIMFRGNSHEESNGKGKTGIGVRYGEGQPLQNYQDGGNANANVEVERGEPAMQMPDNTGNQNLVVFGNLPIPNQFVNQLGDPNAKGKRFKSYVADLSKQEDKQNKLIKNTNDQLQELDPKTPFDKLKFNSLSLALNGANDKLKDLAQKKQNAAHLQQAINDTAEERGIDAEQLAKGNIKKAKKGAVVHKAQTGTNLEFLEQNADELNPSGYAPQDNTVMISPSSSFTNKAQGKGKLSYSTPDQAGGIWGGKNYQTQWIPKVNKAFSNPNTAAQIISNIQNYQGPDAADAKAIIAKEPTMAGKIKIAQQLATDGKVGPYHQIVNSMIDQANSISPMKSPDEQLLPVEGAQVISPSKIDNSQPKKQIPQYFNPIGTYPPTNKEDLDPRQLTGEYYALATNNLEPVPAQQYHPNLLTPYEISMQDILNENTAATRGAQKYMGYNPAAQSNLIARQYAANQKVLGDQFRINQEEKDKVYGQNTNTLNNAQLKNLGILDQQYTRQAQALSNTKSVAQDALSSISAKYLQNKLENRRMPFIRTCIITDMIRMDMHGI